jgi:hypothetical protein
MTAYFALTVGAAAVCFMVTLAKHIPRQLKKYRKSRNMTMHFYSVFKRYSTLEKEDCWDMGELL